MGYYMDPPNMSKEQFLEKHGAKLSESDVRGWDFSTDKLPVCLVDNVMFSAAAILYSAREASDFTLPRDHRRKTFYAVSRSDLEPYYRSKAA